jgi:hypothetical protein
MISQAEYEEKAAVWERDVVLETDVGSLMMLD